MVRMSRKLINSEAAKSISLMRVCGSAAGVKSENEKCESKAREKRANSC